MSRIRPADLFSRIRELTLPRAERQAARSETAARRAVAMRAESHSRHSGGFSQHWRD
jgi:hypothetical protein